MFTSAKMGKKEVLIGVPKESYNFIEDLRKGYPATSTHISSQPFNEGTTFHDLNIKDNSQAILYSCPVIISYV